MKQHKTFFLACGGALSLTLLLAAVAPAASSLTNSLTGFTGGSNTVPTQTAVGAAGLEFSSNAGLAEDFSSDPTIVFDATGATFGTLYGGDGGRNYMRTIDSYAFDSYRAEVTVTVTSLLGSGQQVFMGMGSGIIALWGTPDFAGRPSVFMTPEAGNGGGLVSNAIDGIAGDWYGPTPPCPAGDWCKISAPGFAVADGAGTHRLRMDFDATTKAWTASADINYAGGPFVADVTQTTYDLSLSFDDGIFQVNGWPTNPSKIYFGGDDGAIFKDFSVIVASAGVPGDFDGDTDVDGRDFLEWQRGNSPNGTPGGPVSAADLATWQGAYNGGALSAVTVPEPSSALLLVLGLLGTCRRGRKS